VDLELFFYIRIRLFSRFRIRITIVFQKVSYPLLWIRNYLFNIWIPLFGRFRISITIVEDPKLSVSYLYPAFRRLRIRSTIVVDPKLYFSYLDQVFQNFTSVSDLTGYILCFRNRKKLKCSAKYLYTFGSITKRFLHFPNIFWHSGVTISDLYSAKESFKSLEILHNDTD
jgi:hypothetical protein